jgi:hypothetical protein
MTATASSMSPIDRRNLINTILELPEKDFWDVVDRRGHAYWFVLDKFKNLYECRNCHERHKRLSKKL